MRTDAEKSTNTAPEVHNIVPLMLHSRPRYEKVTQYIRKVMSIKEKEVRARERGEFIF